MKRTIWMAFCVLMLMMSWEGQLSSANVVDNGPIPQESIRLRIIANSDSFQDQWLKREVRDAVIAQMDTWVKDIGTFQDAKKVVAANLPVLQQVVDETIRDRGFSYKAVVDFGQVPFPTKLYGAYVYPAGNYTALRVQIGEAKGQNWWCVLFPPLCFIDMSNGDGVQAAAAAGPKPELSVQTKQSGDELLQTATEAAEEEPTPAVASGRARNGWEEWRQMRLEDMRTGGASDDKPEPRVIAADSGQGEAAETEAAVPEPHVQVRFFLWEKLEKLFS
ncbi:stage II sporulation protein R [Brevibacillus sp. GCM10020057]|uniref:stage II sporulation protein R n=1 Tax=Brevibacillus sp. GCM10020057 TaxID=3317327 RepID=UPI003626BFAC